MDPQNPNSSNIPYILELLNEEFIFSKGRKLRLELRYPGLFEPENFNNLYYLGDPEKIVSFVATKTLNIRMLGEKVQFYLLGCVYTNPFFRGKGYSSKLIQAVSVFYNRRGYQGGILWTTIPEFYKRYGWVKNDNGLLIRFMNEIKDDVNPGIGDFENSEIKNSDEIESFRKKYRKDPIFLIRNDQSINSYRVIPPPAESIRICTIRISGQIKSYLIYGVLSDNVFVYENLGINMKVEEKLLHYFLIENKTKNMFFNLHKYNYSLIKSLRKLTKNIKMENQRLCMWHGNLRSMSHLQKNLYIPFIDRI